MEALKIIAENWELIVITICVLIVTIQKVINFLSLPTAAKESEIRSVLLELVREAEAELGSKTGKFKLAMVYDRFCQRYPDLKKWYPLDKFEKMVDFALWEMRTSINSNAETKRNALQKQED